MPSLDPSGADPVDLSPHPRPCAPPAAARLAGDDLALTEPRAVRRSLGSQDPTSHVDGPSPALCAADDGRER